MWWIVLIIVIIYVITRPWFKLWLIARSCKTQESQVGAIAKQIEEQELALSKARADLAAAKVSGARDELTITSLHVQLKQQKAELAAATEALAYYRRMADTLTAASAASADAQAYSAETASEIRGEIGGLYAQVNQSEQVISGLRDTIAAQAEQIRQISAYSYQLVGPTPAGSTATLTCPAGKYIEVLNAQYGGSVCATRSADLSQCDDRSTYDVVSSPPACAGSNIPQSLAVSYRCR